jgi:hypothetical protein
MQNKPNFLDAQMNVSSDKTKDYNNEQRTMNNELLFKTNPNKPNFTPIASTPTSTSCCGMSYGGNYVL